MPDQSSYTLVIESATTVDEMIIKLCKQIGLKNDDGNVAVFRVKFTRIWNV
jgi:hypothetical protein